MTSPIETEHLQQIARLRRDLNAAQILMCRTVEGIEYVREATLSDSRIEGSQAMAVKVPEMLKELRVLLRSQGVEVE